MTRGAWRACGCLLAVLLACLLGISQQGNAAGPANAAYVGRPVAQVIDEFRSAGYPFAYSTNLVPADLTVSVEPSATGPLELVREILAPYRLTVREERGFLLIVRKDPADASAGSLLLIVRDSHNWRLLDNVRISSEPELPEATELDAGVYQFPSLVSRDYRILVEAAGFEPGSRTVRVRSGKPTVLEVELFAERDAIQMITVSSSRYNIWSDLSTSPFFISQLSIQNLPDIGDDPLRAAQILPGTASTGVSARTFFRGGEYRETAVYLNGNELLDPYHARDFQNIFSTVDSRVIDGIEVYTGSLPIRYGDQLSGAILMNTIDPSVVSRNELGISVYNTSVLMSDALDSGRGGWLVSARRGNLDLVIRPEYGAPRYFDVFGSFVYELSPEATVTANVLYAKDEITAILANSPEKQETGISGTRNFQFWTQLHNQWSDDLRSTSFLSIDSFANTRNGEIDDPDNYVSTVNDLREFNQYKLRQDWEWGFTESHILQWGFEFAFGDSDYSYISDTGYFGLSLLFPGTPATESRRLDAGPEVRAYSLYLADKWQFAPRTFAEYGLRYDQQSFDLQTFSAQVSPRLSLFHATRGGTEFRLGWGRSFQSQDLRELQIEDGITEFQPAQRADQVVAGIRQPLGRNYSLRVELYQKDYDRLRPRFETLFDPLELLPEIVPDRVRIAPASGRARGIELMLDGATDGPLSWWVAYTWSKATDRIDGIDVPRSWDQQQALRAGLTWSTDKWDAAVAVNVHSGWPTTTLSIVETVDANGQPLLVAQPGLRNAERFADYASVDGRVNRKFRFGDHKIFNVFVEVSNVANRENPCCVEFDLFLDENNVPQVEPQEDFWLPLLPAIGFLLEF